MSAKLENMLNQLKVLILCGLAVLATQAVNLKGELDILPATLGMQGLILDLTKQISAGQIGTVILAIAGVSIGCKLDDIKKLSWKIILTAFVVFIGTFFGSALVAELILKLQGII